MIGKPDKFATFINNLERIANQSPRPWEKYGAYDLKRYISDSQGRILVDHVFKLEDIATEFVDKMSEFGIQIDKVDHKYKQTKKYEYRQHYDEHTRSKVAKLYKYEIEMFNYTF